MKTALLTDTIDSWVGYLRDRHVWDLPGDEQVRNWLFGAGLALKLLDDPALQEIAFRALEASKNGHIRDRNVGAGTGGVMGHSGVDSQRQDLADGGDGR